MKWKETHDSQWKETYNALKRTHSEKKIDLKSHEKRPEVTWTEAHDLQWKVTYNSLKQNLQWDEKRPKMRWKRPKRRWIETCYSQYKDTLRWGHYTWMLDFVALGFAHQRRAPARSPVPRPPVTCVYQYICIYVYICTHIQLYIIHGYVCKVHVLAHPRPPVTCIHDDICVYVYIYICIFIYICIYIYILYIHTYLHTSAQDACSLIIFHTITHVHR